MHLREIQTRMSALGFYPKELVDGKWGPKSAAGIRAMAARFKVNVSPWHSSRQIIAAGQMICRMDAIDAGAVDGLMGPQTRQAFEVYEARKANGGKPVHELEKFRDNMPTDPVPVHTRWPRQTLTEMTKFYGPAGANTTSLLVPAGYPMVLYDGPQPVKRITVHEKIHDPVLRVLERVLDHYGPDKIRALNLNRYFGCLNVRPMRGGSAPSTHSWAAALDFDANNNQLRWNKSRALLARPECVKWWEFWEAEGFVSLGRARDFDWMHVQAATL